MNGVALRAQPGLVFSLVLLWIIDPAAAAESTTRSQATPHSAIATQQEREVDVELDEVAVTGRRERARMPDPDASFHRTNNVFVGLDEGIGVKLNLVMEQSEVVFRRTSTARLLPEPGSKLFTVNRRLRLELRPDRLIAGWPSHAGDAAYQLASDIDEADGLPAHIPFGPNVALVNLDYLSMHHDRYTTRIFAANVMHPQTRRCEQELSIFQLWPEGTNQYVLLGNSLRSCERFTRSREADLLFAESIPREFRQVVMEIHDPIASRLANRLGSEPGNIFIAWWPESPHDGYRLQPSWNRNSLLLFHGSSWQQGIDASQRESLRTSFMHEQIQRRIRESDWPGPFTQSAVRYLLLLTSSEENNTTRQILIQELPSWLTSCADAILNRSKAANSGQDVPSFECGLVLQFVYDAVARSSSAGELNIFSTWRKLLNAAFRARSAGVRPENFLDSSSEAQSIAQGLADGEIDWPGFAVALENHGVTLAVDTSGTSPGFEVKSLENFGG